MTAVIRLEDIMKTYVMGDAVVHALDHVSVEIGVGEFTSIMGPSGSGKSTMMNILGCLDRPTSGQYYLDGKEVAGYSDDELARTRNAKIGFVFQNFNLLPKLSAQLNVALPLVYAGIGEEERLERAKTALEAVGLGDRIDHNPTEMSGGQRQRHKIKAGDDDDFTVRNLAALMETMMETANTITLLLGCIAAISLLVGGIGIMNIMLVSVTERTREIGIRKALGATYNNILLQFLIEAMVIGVVGGTLGVILGIGSSYAISYFAGWQTVISIPTIIIAVVFSVGIGLFFGIYPARKAALLDPIEALRYE